MKKERIGLVAAVLLIVWLSAALVRVENERYAMQVGMCWLVCVTRACRPPEPMQPCALRPKRSST
jgi:hypothetical protein